MPQVFSSDQADSSIMTATQILNSRISKEENGEWDLSRQEKYSVEKRLQRSMAATILVRTMSYVSAKLASYVEEEDILQIMSCERRERLTDYY